MEDEDLYRFLPEAAASVGAELVTIRDGRTPWDVLAASEAELLQRFAQHDEGIVWTDAMRAGAIVGWRACELVHRIPPAAPAPASGGGE